MRVNYRIYKSDKNDGLITLKCFTGVPEEYRYFVIPETRLFETMKLITDWCDDFDLIPTFMLA